MFYKECWKEFKLSQKGFLSDDFIKIDNNEKIQTQKNLDENTIPWINEFVTYSPSYRN